MRTTWDRYFIDIAHAVASRGTCDRLAVGCVVATTCHRILATGYNGSLRGAPHCADVDHRMHDGHCTHAVHAEANAVCAAAAHGVALAGAVAYVTHAPCRRCLQLLAAAGITRIVYDRPYTDELRDTIAAEAGIRLERLSDSTSNR